MRMRFAINDDSPIMDMDIRHIGLKSREANCLLRGGMMTVGDVVRRITREEDLMDLRNCGQLMAHRIMVALFRLFAEEAAEKEDDAFYRNCKLIYPEVDEA